MSDLESAQSPPPSDELDELLLNFDAERHHETSQYLANNALTNAKAALTTYINKYYIRKET